MVLSESHQWQIELDSRNILIHFYDSISVGLNDSKGGGVKFEAVKTGIKFWYVTAVYTRFTVELSCVVFLLFCPGFSLRHRWCTRLFSGILLVLGGPFRFSVAFVFLQPALASFQTFSSLDISRHFLHIKIFKKGME